MKTVVITGSARGFGYSMLELFRKNNFNCILTDINKMELENAYNKLMLIESSGEILKIECDVTNIDDVKNLINKTLEKFGSIDIFINNAGVNQNDKLIWETDDNTIKKIFDINLYSVIMCSKLVVKQMIEQGAGQIYFVEGFGSNNAVRKGLSLYGTTKRAVSYFSTAFANEIGLENKNILIGRITPGIMITNFINTSLGDGEHIEIDEKTKKVYNILGDYPETIANYMVPKIINNVKNNVDFVWLTNKRAFVRFLTSAFNKRNFFK